MNETYVTLRGWLGADVRHQAGRRHPGRGVPGSALTPRWFDRKTGEWVERRDQWYAVTAGAPGRQLRRLAAARRPGGRPRPAEPEHLVSRTASRARRLEVTAAVGRPRPITGQQPFARSCRRERARASAGRAASRRWWPRRRLREPGPRASEPSALSRPVRTVRKASSSCSTGATTSSSETRARRRGASGPRWPRGCARSGRPAPGRAAPGGCRRPLRPRAAGSGGRCPNRPAPSRRPASPRRPAPGSSRRRRARPGSAATGGPARRWPRPGSGPRRGRCRRSGVERSPISSSREVEALRTASAHGRVIPADTSSARARTSVSTLARCTGESPRGWRSGPARPGACPRGRGRGGAGAAGPA